MRFVLIALLLVFPALPAFAVPVTLSSDYLLIGMGPSSGAGPTGTAVNINSFELGQITGPLPGSAPPLPANALPVQTGVKSDGNIAITSNPGTFNLQNVQVAATPGIGIRCAGSSCDAGSSNSTISFNGGISYTPIPATGVTTSFNFAPLLSELSTAKTTILGLGQTDVLDVSANSGKISATTTFSLNPGLNVIDIITGGQDFLIENNSTLVIDGPPGSSAIFRFLEPKSFKTSNANIAVGDSGIGLNNVLFFSENQTQLTKFDFSNTIVNGVAFWDLSDTGSPFGLNNVAGCTQLVGDFLNNLNNVRLTQCGFEQPEVVPEPASLALLGSGLVALGLGSLYTRRRHA